MRYSKRRNNHDDRPMAEINVTPLVDVMLVLLIIFMAVSYTHLTLPTKRIV